MIGMMNVDNRSDGMIFLDGESDKEGLSQYAIDHNLVQGTTAMVIDTGEMLIMKSDRTWKSTNDWS